MIHTYWYRARGATLTIERVNIWVSEKNRHDDIK